MDLYSKGDLGEFPEEFGVPEAKTEELVETWMKDAYEILNSEGVDKKYEDIDYSLLLNYMLEYFENSEEYEKCSNLLKLKKQIDSE